MKSLDKLKERALAVLEREEEQRKAARRAAIEKDRERALAEHRKKAQAVLIAEDGLPYLSRGYVARLLRPWGATKVQHLEDRLAGLGVPWHELNGLPCINALELAAVLSAGLGGSTDAVKGVLRVHVVGNPDGLAVPPRSVQSHGRSVYYPWGGGLLREPVRKRLYEDAERLREADPGGWTARATAWTAGGDPEGEPAKSPEDARLYPLEAGIHVDTTGESRFLWLRNVGE